MLAFKIGKQAFSSCYTLYIHSKFTMTKRFLSHWLFESYGPWEYRPWKIVFDLLRRNVHLRGRVDCSDNIPLSRHISLCQWIQIIVKVFQRSGRLVSTNTVYRVSSMEKKWTGCLEYWVRHINSKLLLCLLNPLKSDQHQFFPNNISSYRVARNFCGSLFSRIGDFLCFAGTNFCD